MGDVNLVIQTQRLGDIVMSFPLCSWLSQESGKQVWLVGEEGFYKDLFRLSPDNLAYTTLSESEFLTKNNFDTTINLSHNPNTFLLSAQIKSHKFYGTIEQDGVKKIHGMWQLYRASLTHNNHYNTFHWADLNALDCISLKTIQNHVWTRYEHGSTGKIGIFVGASEAGKRPNVEFWADLALSLAKKGYEPIFLGGPSQEELEICQAAASRANMPNAYLAGRFNLFEFTTFLHTLDLFITPDTGPMHLASIKGVKTFNLSMGNVNPFETGPYPPNHYVLRPKAFCFPCWKCNQTEQFCKKYFIPNRIANLIHNLLQNKTLPNLPNLILSKTSRTEEGLYHLEDLQNEKTYLQEQNNFWNYFFADYFFLLQNKDIFSSKRRGAAQNLFQTMPNLQPFFKSWQHKLLKNILPTIKHNVILAEDSWQKYPPLIRPLSNFIQLLLENESYSKQGKNSAFQLLEFFQEHIKD